MSKSRSLRKAAETVVIRERGRFTKLEQYEFAKQLDTMQKVHPILRGYVIRINRNGDVLAVKSDSVRTGGCEA